MMPALSPLMTEGTITRWKKKEGDAFAAGDILLQIVSSITSRLNALFIHFLLAIRPLHSRRGSLRFGYLGEDYCAFSLISFIAEYVVCF